ncbi:MAG: NAD(P)/FAD-dependent oxidoreductase [Polyangiaceae bacterium]
MPLVSNPDHNHSSEILIVGGGPVGLFGALCAAKRGLAVTLLDRGFRGYARGHATLLHPASLQLMSEFGLSSKLLAAGCSIGRVDLHLDDDFSTTLELPTPALSIPQTTFEEILLTELRRTEVGIESPWDATSLVQTAAGVQVQATRRELKALGSPTVSDHWEGVESSMLHAQFVIGADGRESRVRAGLGIETLTAGAGENFAMFEGSRSVPRHDFALSFSHGLGAMALPLPGDCGRWGFQLAEGTELVPDVAHLHSLLAERAAWEPNPPERLHWSALVHFERRLAHPFGRERVWLAGDAAHCTSPFGGQSVNGGLLEVHELVETMAGCLKGVESRGEIERLAARREREWQRLIGINTRLETRPGEHGTLSKYAARIVPALPASGRDLQHLLSQLGLTVY